MLRRKLPTQSFYEYTSPLWWPLAEPGASRAAQQELAPPTPQPITATPPPPHGLPPVALVGVMPEPGTCRRPGACRRPGTANSARCFVAGCPRRASTHIHSLSGGRWQSLAPRHSLITPLAYRPTPQILKGRSSLATGRRGPDAPRARKSTSGRRPLPARASLGTF